MDNLELYAKLTSAPKYLRGDAETSLRFDYTPQITQNDIDKGSINRYFARQANHVNGEIVEINKTQYDLIKDIPLYQTIVVPWRISGRLDDIKSSAVQNAPIRLYTGVLTSNRLAVDAADQEMNGMKLKLTNPSQFYHDKG